MPRSLDTWLTLSQELWWSMKLQVTSSRSSCPNSYHLTDWAHTSVIHRISNLKMSWRSWRGDHMSEGSDFDPLSQVLDSYFCWIAPGLVCHFLQRGQEYAVSLPWLSWRWWNVDTVAFVGMYLYECLVLTAFLTRVGPAEKLIRLTCGLLVRFAF